MDYSLLIGVLIVVVAAAVGFRDLLRFRLRRVNAIAGVCFSESIRRRVLWITPLAILGVIAVAQFQKSTDAQDDIRQITRYCLFASGLIVTVAAGILASTNLPREIETRVIFTVVTKPTTRLEIVLGKVMGFALVSGLILLIMGAFTWTYLEVRSASRLADVRASLRSGDYDPGSRSTLEHYASAGLLSTKSLDFPASLETVSRISARKGVSWLAGGQAMYYDAPFDLTSADADAIQSAYTRSSGGGGGMISITLQVERHAASAAELQEMHYSRSPTEQEYRSHGFGPMLPETPVPLPQVGVMLLDAHGAPMASKEIKIETNLPAPVVGMKFVNPLVVHVPLSGEAVRQMLTAQRFVVEVQATTPSVEFGVDANATQLEFFPRGVKSPPYWIKSLDSTRPGAPAPRIYSRVGRTGMQLRGKKGGTGSIAVFHFDRVEVPPSASGRASLQIRLTIERSGDLDASGNVESQITVQVRNRETGRLGPLVVVEPETKRASYVDVPAIDLAPAHAGDRSTFDVLLRGITPGQTLGLSGPAAPVPSVALVIADHSFTLNLFKSLLILWLLADLVIIAAVLGSTFLSWPIALVLTLMLLASRWGVDELGDALAPGHMRGVGADIFGIRDPSRDAAITHSLEAVSGSLRVIVTLLPDLSKFPAFEDISRGVDIAPAKVGLAAEQLLGYGVPAMLLTWLILKRKEVAP